MFIEEYGEWIQMGVAHHPSNSVKVRLDDLTPKMIYENVMASGFDHWAIVLRRNGELIDKKYYPEKLKRLIKQAETIYFQKERGITPPEER